MRLRVKLVLFWISFVNAQETGLPYGHPNRCRDYLNVKYADLPTLGELPGEGFDNLVNVPMATVVDTKYTMCRTTGDGHFLIPDSVTVVPSKKSHLQSTSSYFQHWDEFTSTTSKSINIGAGFTSFFTQISGKFSQEYESIKTRQVFEKTRTMRMQLRHTRYRANLVHGASLHPSFKKAVEEIAFLIASDRKELALYESQILVRQYGTHVVTGIELGASLVKIDQLSEDIETKSKSDKRSIQLAAEISFFHWLDGNHNRTRNYTLGFGFNEATLSQSMSEYINLRQSTEMYSLGGSIITLEDNNDHSWGNSVEGNLVALDRMGDPIYFFINKDTLPGIPDPILESMADIIKDAVESYYKHNVIRGCTDPDSPNFSFEANINDGTCQAPNNTNSYAFGGVFQTCTASGKQAEVCQGLTFTNPLTGDYSCPQGFQPQLINSRSFTRPFQRVETTSCGFLWASTCHRYYDYNVYGSYSASWCFGTPGVIPAQDLLFGGTFSPYHVNLITQGYSCPNEFQTLRVLDQLSVCVTQDKEQGKKFSVPFGGFYSCSYGNPFETNKHSCPNGYSQHLAHIDNGCEIDFCIKSGAIDLFHLPTIQRPPYMPKPMYNETNQFAIAKNGTFMIELGDISPVSDTVPIFTNNLKENEVTESNVKENNVKDDKLKASRATFVSPIIVIITCVPLIIGISFC